MKKRYLGIIVVSLGVATAYTLSKPIALAQNAETVKLTNNSQSKPEGETSGQISEAMGEKKKSSLQTKELTEQEPTETETSSEENLLEAPPTWMIEEDSEEPLVVEALEPEVHEEDTTDELADDEKNQRTEETENGSDSTPDETEVDEEDESIEEELQPEDDEENQEQDTPDEEDGDSDSEPDVVEEQPVDKIPEGDANNNNSNNNNNSSSNGSQPGTRPVVQNPKIENNPSEKKNPPKVEPANRPSVDSIHLPSAVPESVYAATRLPSHLPESFLSDSPANANLSGYSLPLQNTFEESWQAALSHAVVRQVGLEQEEEIDTETWITQLYSEIFDNDLTQVELIEVPLDEVIVGDVLYQETESGMEMLGVQLDSEYVAQVITEEKALDEDEETSEQEETTEEFSFDEASQSRKTDDEETQTISEVRLSPYLALRLDLIDTATFGTMNQIEEINEHSHVWVKRIASPELTEEGEVLVKEYPAPFDIQPNEATDRFIEEIAEDSRELGLEYDVFASVMMAQAILESASGTSGLALPPYYNLFGIKGSYQGASVMLSTSEDNGNGELYQIQDAFRTYPNYAHSLTDYIQLIRGGISGNSTFYEDVWRSESKNYLQATSALTGTYATDTFYNKKLNSIIAAYNLTQFDQPRIEDSGLFIHERETIPSEYRQLMVFPDYDDKDYNSSGSYPIGQCTWYVYNRVAQLGGSVDDYMGNGSDWGQTGQRLGYEIRQAPQPGRIISFGQSVAGADPIYGHVAFVEAVGPNGILISESNVYDDQTISYRIIDNEVAYSPLVTYIIPK